MCHRAVHLPDRRRREGNRIPLREHTLGIAAELLANHRRAQLRRHRRRVLLQRGECRPHGFGQTVVEIARHLPELHHGALQLSERRRDFARSLELIRGVELGVALGAATARRAECTTWRAPDRAPMAASRALRPATDDVMNRLLCRLTATAIPATAPIAAIPSTFLARSTAHHRGSPSSSPVPRFRPTTMGTCIVG